MLFKEFIQPGNLLSNNQQVNREQIPNLPAITLDLPTKKITSKITDIKYNQNPIVISFADGTRWTLIKKQWDYLISTGNKPKINSKIELEMYLDGSVKTCKIS